MVSWATHPRSIPGLPAVWWPAAQFKIQMAAHAGFVGRGGSGAGLPTITCKCKRRRCSVDGCGKCSRCGCDCDGVSIAVKRARTRGRPPTLLRMASSGEEVLATRVDLQQANSTETLLVPPEIDLVPLLAVSDQEKSAQTPNQHLRVIEEDDHDFYELGTTSPVGSGTGPATTAGWRVQNEAGMYRSPAIFTPTPKRQKRVDIFAVMRVLGCDDSQVSSMRKKIPAKERRCSRSFWTVHDSNADNGNDQHEREDQPSLRQERAASLRLVWLLLNHICTIMCGVSAGPAFLELFLSWISPTQLSALSEITTPARVFVATKRGSIERRCIRALLCDAFPLAALRKTADEVDGFCFGKNSYTAGRKDMQVLLEEGALTKPKWSRAKYDKRALDEATNWVLSMDNVAFLSWGTKTIRLDGQKHAVPSIQRRKPITVIFDQYRARGGTVPRSTFYRLAGVLTHGEVESRCAVDYVTGFLVNDTFGILERIVRELLPDESGELLPKLTILRAWLKYGSGFDIDDESQPDFLKCPTHQVEYGLSMTRHADTCPRPVCCGPCVAMRALMDKISYLLTMAEVDATTLGVLKDSYKKMELFLGHRIRVRNQQRALREAAANMKARCTDEKRSNEAIVILDFKMKLEPSYFREKTVEHTVSAVCRGMEPW